MPLSTSSTSWRCNIETKNSYQDFFSSEKVLFLNSTMSYQEFWGRVITKKLPKEKYIGLPCESIDSLITYMAIVCANKVAVLLDPLSSQSEIKKKEEIFLENNDCFALYSPCSQENYKAFTPSNIIDKNLTNTIIFTSGTTSKPKPIELCFNNFYESSKASSKHYNIKETDCWAMSLSFFHVGGLMIFYRTIFNQLSTVLLQPNDFQRHIIDYPEITILSLVELQLRKIFEKPSTIERAQELKGIVLGGMKTSLKTIQEACDHEIYISNSYGQTETCSQICATDFCIDVSTLLTSGVALGSTKITILESQQIAIESPSIANGVYPDTKFASYLLTNDIGEVDVYRQLTVKGRIDDVIISAGKKISPQKITNALYNSKLGIDFALTFPIQDEKYTNRPASIISLKNIISEEEIKEALLENEISRVELPKLIVQTTNFDDLKNGIKISPNKCKSILNRISPFYDLLGHPTIRGNINGEWLFVFHGFMGGSRDFFFLSKVLEDRYLVFYVNLPGHTKTNLSQEVSFFKYSDDILNELYKQDQKISVLGYSLGGRFASVLCAQSKKDTITKLILESSGLGIQDSEKKTRKAKDEELLSNIKSEQQFKSFLHTWYDQAIFKGIKDSPRDYELSLNKEFSLIEGFKNSLKNHGQALMPSLTVLELKKKCSNIFYIYGENDRKYEMIANQMQHESIKVFKMNDLGHICHITSNNKYLDLIGSILLK